MSNKLNIPVYIISLNNNSYFNFNDYFNNVNYVKATDTRKDTPIKYLNDNIITVRVYNDLKYGRKDHFAFPGMGAIGLYLTYRKIINDNININKNILICEEDCLIDNIPEFKRKVKILNNTDFDCAIFGSFNYKHKKLYNNNNNNLNLLNLNDYEKDFYKCNNIFLATQSIIWSPNGIKKMKNEINKIISVQLDAFFSYECLYNNLNLLIEKKNTTSQKVHLSTLDNGKPCKLCNVNPKFNYNNIYLNCIYTFIVIFIIVLILLLIKCKSKS